MAASSPAVVHDVTRPRGRRELTTRRIICEHHQPPLRRDHSGLVVGAGVDARVSGDHRDLQGLIDDIAGA
jgi:hypothetical protein